VTGELLRHVYLPNGRPRSDLDGLDLGRHVKGDLGIVLAHSTEGMATEGPCMPSDGTAGSALTIGSSRA
jgi:hypothetical protein